MNPKLRPLARCSPSGMRVSAWETERRAFVHARHALGWSQLRCASELGVSRQTVERWETTGPSMTALPAWAVRTMRELAGVPSSKRTGT